MSDLTAFDPDPPKTNEATSSVDPQEREKFSRLAQQWWDPNGPFKPLHQFNPVRLAAIRELIEDHFDIRRDQLQPFQGLNLLDVGCGGGLVSEPMCRLGANVTGIDASQQNIEIARAHARSKELVIDYQTSTVEDLLAQKEPPAKFDIILNLEVAEHVNAPFDFLENSASLLNSNGIMLIATLNRTVKAFALAIIGAEYILGWLPRRTHDFDRFIKPSELRDHFENSNYQLGAAVGFTYSPFSDRWRQGKDTDVNYLLPLVRRKESFSQKQSDKAGEI